MKQARTVRRRLIAAALVTTGTFALPVMAEIPTPALTADGGPPASTPKPSAPRTEQRTAERQTPAEPSQG